MERILCHIAFIIASTAFPNGTIIGDTHKGESNDYGKEDYRKQPQPFSLRQSSVKPKYRPQNRTKQMYPSMEVNRRTNPPADDISDNVDTTTSNRSDVNSKQMKSGRGMKSPMGKGMPGPGSASQSGDKTNGTIKWILIIGIIVVAAIILLLTIYALWIWCSPVETNKIIIEEELKSEGMTDDELKRFRMRFGRD